MTRINLTVRSLRTWLKEQAREDPSTVVGLAQHEQTCPIAELMGVQGAIDPFVLDEGIAEWTDAQRRYHARRLGSTLCTFIRLVDEHELKMPITAEYALDILDLAEREVRKEAAGGHA